jgi:Lar family restriction alleviation protein
MTHHPEAGDAAPGVQAQEAELESCPFCGCDDNVWLVDPDDGDLFKFVTCNRCDARGPEKFVAAEAVAGWNSRTSASTIATLRKAVLDVHDALHRECSGDVDLPAEIRALRSRITADAERIERLENAIRDVWPHLTGHCFEGATPECFGYMRDRLSAVVGGLPYASDETPLSDLLGEVE